MNHEDTNTLCEALIKYELMPKYKKTKQDENDACQLRTVLKKGKQKNIHRFAELALALIRDKTTLDPKLHSEHSEFFIKIINSYPGKTVSEIVEAEVNLRQTEQATRKIRDEEIYELQEGLERKKIAIGTIFEENEHLKMQLAESESTRTHYFNELQKYDSDNSSEEELDYEKLEITEILVNEKIDELIDYDYDNDQTEEEVRIAQQKRLEQLAPPPVKRKPRSRPKNYVMRREIEIENDQKYSDELEPESQPSQNPENKEGAAEAAAAKAYFESLEKVNEQKRVANRLKYEMSLD